MATAFSIVSGDIFESSLLGYLRGQARRIFFFFFGLVLVLLCLWMYVLFFNIKPAASQMANDASIRLARSPMNMLGTKRYFRPNHEWNGLKFCPPSVVCRHMVSR